ncbi:MAG: heat-inducible transcription repressor HrcA [Magnetococcales bacterium]|nr:heat-inducible transcription repressor HrcA [Magnetococcales bacterium]
MTIVCSSRLTPRQSDILKKVVESHIADGEPVGSQSMRQRYHLDLSSASIRNVMAELEEMGFLFRVHHSSGRAPTELGFRFYVDGLLEVSSLSQEEKDRILMACEEGRTDLDRAFIEVGRVLATLSSNACLVRPIGTGRTLLRGIRFIQLDNSRVGTTRIMAVLVAINGQVDSRVFVMPGLLSQQDLDRHGTTLSRLLDGATLREAREYLQRALERGEQVYHDLCGTLLESLSRDRHAGELLINGRMNFFLSFGGGPTAPLDLQRAREALAILEEKRHLIQLLDHCLETGGVRLFIGSESALGAGRCAIVASSFTGPTYTAQGAVGVLGPTRLDYAHVIPLVEFTAKVLSTLLADTSLSL